MSSNDIIEMSCDTTMLIAFDGKSVCPDSFSGNTPIDIVEMFVPEDSK